MNIILLNDIKRGKTYYFVFILFRFLDKMHSPMSSIKQQQDNVFIAYEDRWVIHWRSSKIIQKRYQRISNISLME